jgi:aspartyl-tRNA(Asn)/glutamyl-tRNA(Gln) amidotransferase subunit C
VANLDRTELAAIASLARLELDEGELGRLGAELGAVLDHMAALAQVDTAGVPPMTHAVPGRTPLRPDDVGPSLPVSDALADAPDRDGDAFRVPAAIPGER